MNIDNMCHLEGTVLSYPLYGDNWTRYNRHQRGQVRFWLGVSRELAGEGLDLLLCAIEPKTTDELFHYERELRGGRSVQIAARARSLSVEIPGESTPGVIFVAESCGFDGTKAQAVHQVHRKPAVVGKMAAAGEGAELALEVEK